MSAIVRKTYDTDSIVLRRIFVVDPTTNTRVSTNSVLVTGLNGSAAFQDGSLYLSTIGAPTSDSLVSTVTGLGTLGYLSVGTAGDVTSGQLISTVTGLGNIYLSSGSGTGDVSKENLTSTTQGLGTLSYLSSSQLLSTVAGLGNIYLSTGSGGTGDVTRANLTSTTLGLGTLGYLSSSQLISTVTGLGNLYLSTGSGTGDVSKDNLTSTTQGLGTLSYLSSSQLFSTVAGLGNIYLSTVEVSPNNLTSTTLGLGTLGYVSSSQLISTVAGLGTLYLSTALSPLNLTSTTEGLGSLGYISTSQLVSTVANLLNTFSTVYNISSAGGVNISATTSGFFLDLTDASISTLINNNITINTSGGNVNDVDLTSTNRGLGTFGYISSLTLIQSLQSTVTGLGTNGYLSTAVTKVIAGSNITISPENGQGIVTINATASGGGSGDVTSTNLTSTTLGLGTLGYISVATLGLSLASTTANLARLGYVSSTALPSTVLGLSRFYVSTASLQANLSSFSTGLTNNFFTRNLTVSTITADLLNISTISFGTGSGFITFPFLKAIYISSGSTQTDIAYVSKSISGAQLQFSSLEGDGSLLTNLVTGIPSSLQGLGSLGYLSSVSFNALVSTPFLDTTLQSTVEGLGSLGYLSTVSFNDLVSTAFLDTTFQSTVDGLATTGYLSAPRIKLTQLLTNEIQTSTLTLLNYRGFPDPMPINGALYTLFVSSGNFYIGDGGLVGLDGLPSESNQIITDTQLTSTSVGYTNNFTTSSLTVSSISFGDEFGYLSLGDVQTESISTFTITTSSIQFNNSFLTASTYISSVELQNLQLNNLYVNTFGPIRVKKSTLGAHHLQLEAYDISKYFLFTQTNAGFSVALPTYNESFEGWNCVIRNMPDSSVAFAISTVTDPPAGTNIAPGTTVTILGSENSYYIL
jgi:hypothetical protein